MTVPSGDDGPIPARGKAAWIADAIRADIAAGVLKPGDALAQEAVLTEQYEVSQPTMRAALRILESDGLVRIQWGPGGGPRVQELDVDVLAQRAGLYLQVQGADLGDLMEALLLLQPGAVALAARRRTPEHLAALHEVVARTHGCTTMAEFSEAAADFVVLLLEASGNRSIELFALVIRSLVHQELNRFLADVPGVGQISWHAQRFGEVVSLIESGEGEAAAALWHAHMLATTPPAMQGRDLPEPTTRRRVADQTD